MKYQISSILAVCALALGSASCAQTKGAIPPAKSAPDALAAAWGLVGMRGISDTHEGLPSVTLEIDLTEQRVSGFNSCNRYFGSIARLDSGVLEFAPLASTRMACPDDALEAPFMGLMREVRGFAFAGDTLSLTGSAGEPLLRFLPSARSSKVEPDARLGSAGGADWVAMVILGQSVQGAHPTLRIDTHERRLSGDDTCNSFSGAITRLTDKAIEFQLATTLRMCPDMTTANAFGAAMARVSAYRFADDELVLLDVEGEELVRCRRQVSIKCAG